MSANVKIKLASGAFLQMTMLGFSSAMDLFMVISDELKAVNLAGFNFKSLEDDLDINALKEVILQFVGSKKLKEALKPAFDRSLYNDQKVNDDLFENVDARSDYFIICWEVIKYNVTPFLPKNVFGLLTNQPNDTITPKSK